MAAIDTFDLTPVSLRVLCQQQTSMYMQNDPAHGESDAFQSFPLHHTQPCEGSQVTR